MPVDERFLVGTHLDFISSNCSPMSLEVITCKYTSVNSHSNGTSEQVANMGFSIAILVYWRVVVIYTIVVIHVYICNYIFLYMAVYIQGGPPTTYNPFFNLRILTGNMQCLSSWVCWETHGGDGDSFRRVGGRSEVNDLEIREFLKNTGRSTKHR